MIAKMRGGPKNRQTLHVKDGTYIIDVTGYRKPTNKDLRRREYANWENIPQRGRYSRVTHPLIRSPGVPETYAFVFLGWEDYDLDLLSPI